MKLQLENNIDGVFFFHPFPSVLSPIEVVMNTTRSATRCTAEIQLTQSDLSIIWKPAIQIKTRRSFTFRHKMGWVDAERSPPKRKNEKKNGAFHHLHHHKLNNSNTFWVRGWGDQRRWNGFGSSSARYRRILTHINSPIYCLRDALLRHKGKREKTESWNVSRKSLPESLGVLPCISKTVRDFPEEKSAIEMQQRAAED